MALPQMTTPQLVGASAGMIILTIIFIVFVFYLSNREK